MITKTSVANFIEQLNIDGLKLQDGYAEGEPSDYFFEMFEEWMVAINSESNFVVELLVEHKDLRDRFFELVGSSDVFDFFEPYLSPSEEELFYA